MSASSRGSYHHGDLKTALIEAATALIREEGVEGFSLRKATQRAGVSPGASAHHFSGVKGLLTAVAIGAFGALRAALEATPLTDNAAQNLRAMAHSYITFAAENPGLFRLICRVDLIAYQDPALADAAYAAMFHYGRAAATYYGAEPLDPHTRALRPDLIGAVATAHGLAHMILEGRPGLLFQTPNPTATFIEKLLPSILAGTWPEQHEGSP